MRILFITLSNIGDAVMTTPVLQRLHQYYPDAVIDIVADARSAEIFNHCPYRGEIFLKRKKEGWRGLLKLIRQLRRRRYDLAVDLRTDGLTYLLRARQRLTKRQARPFGPHAVQDHMGVIHTLGDSIPPTTLWLTETLRDEAAARLATLPGKRWLALGPGANWEPKIWAVEQFRDLAAQVSDHFDAVILLGGPKDRDRAEAVANGLPLPHLDLCGETGLLQATAILERAAAFVGNDSGLGHLASAVGTPTLVVFGPGRPERYHPWGPHCTWIRGKSDSLTALGSKDVAQALIDHLARQP